MKLNLLISLSIFITIYSSEQSLKLPNFDSHIDLILTHIKALEINYNKEIHGFHHYQISNDKIEHDSTVNISDAIKDITVTKTCKINNNLWVVTKGNPYKFHSGYVSYISTDGNQYLGIKNFFPCAWKEFKLKNQITKIISRMKNEAISKKKSHSNNEYVWIINTEFKNQIIRLIIVYNYARKKIISISMYPVRKEDSKCLDIESSIVFEIMEKQLKNKEGIA